MMEINSIGIIGAGTMGSGIAWLCASAGFDTILFDINRDAIDRGLKNIHSIADGAMERGKLTSQEKENSLQRIIQSFNLQDVKCDLIIEAALEKLDVKKDIFSKLAEVNSPDTILSSNTSSIPITQIAYGIQNPQRVVGMHFFNPAHIMKLVEVISGADTSPEVSDAVYELSKKLGKTPVRVKDSPGFIVNRVARSYYVEALKILEEGVADIETIDNLMESAGFKMGPFKLMDLIGVDTNFDVTSSIYNQFMQEPRFRPSRTQKQKVDAGHNGKKSGNGFYSYPKK